MLAILIPNAACQSPQIFVELCKDVRIPRISFSLYSGSDSHFFSSKKTTSASASPSTTQSTTSSLRASTRCVFLSLPGSRSQEIDKLASPGVRQLYLALPRLHTRALRLLCRPSDRVLQLARHLRRHWSLCRSRPQGVFGALSWLD